MYIHSTDKFQSSNSVDCPVILLLFRSNICAVVVVAADAGKVQEHHVPRKTDSLLHIARAATAQVNGVHLLLEMAKLILTSNSS